MSPVHVLLIDTPLIPDAQVERRRVRSAPAGGANPRRLGRMERMQAAVQLLAGTLIFAELDLWPTRAAIRNARVLKGPGGVHAVFGGWPVSLSAVHARLGGGEPALRTTRDAALAAIARCTGVPLAMLAPGGGIDWLSYESSLARLLDELPKPLPRATARSLWAQRLHLPPLPGPGEVGYWEVPDAGIATRLGAVASRHFQGAGLGVALLRTAHEGAGELFDVVTDDVEAVVAVGSPKPPDLLGLERMVERGQLDRALVFGAFPLGWTPPRPRLDDPESPEGTLILAGLPRDRMRLEAARWARRLDPLAVEDRRALTEAASRLFAPDRPQRRELDERDVRVLEVLRLDPGGVPEDVALTLCGMEGKTFARRAQGIGACWTSGRWRLTVPAAMTPSPLHAELAARIPEGSPERLVHEMLAGADAGGLEAWCRRALDDLRAGEVRTLLADVSPEAVPESVLELWIEACLADLDLTQARRLLDVLPETRAHPWRAWLDAIDRPGARGVTAAGSDAPVRVAAEVALRRLEADGLGAGDRGRVWLDVLDRAARQLDGALARRFEIEKTLVGTPERWTDRGWRKQIVGGSPELFHILMRRGAIVSMHTGEMARAERILERLAFHESRPGPAGLIQLDLGWLALHRGDQRVADARHFRAYRLLQAAGFQYKTRNVLFNLAVSDLDRLDVSRARKRLTVAAEPDDPARKLEEARLELAMGHEATFRAVLERFSPFGEGSGTGLDQGLSFLRGAKAILDRRDGLARELLQEGGQEAYAWLALLDALEGHDAGRVDADDGWGVWQCARLVRRLDGTGTARPQEFLPGSPDLRAAFALALAERLLGRQEWVPSGWRRRAAEMLDGAGLDGWANGLRGAHRAPDGFLRALRSVIEAGGFARLAEQEIGQLMAGAGVSGLEVRSRIDGRVLVRLGDGEPGPDFERGGLMLVPLGGDPAEHDGWALLSSLVPLVVDVPLPGSSVDTVTSGLYGESEAMHRLREDLQKLAPTRLPVAFFGETGVGKDVAAQALHRLSGRRGRFVAVNMAALPPHLVEAELFGAVRGAFTGAERSRRGLVVASDGGTLFLDEIGDLDLALQAKLLRFLESGEVRAVGADRPVAVDVRIVTATHRDLEKRMRDGRFRPDLFYRISSAAVYIPPLRERREDVPVLRALFEAQAISRDGLPPVRWSREAEEMLLGYAWPGNVRELRHVVDLAMVRAMGGVVRPEHLPRDLTTMAGHAVASGGTYEEAMTAFRRRFLEQALLRHDGNRSATARELGISRQTLLYHIRALGLTV